MKIKNRLKIAVASLVGGAFTFGSGPVLADQLDDLLRQEAEVMQVAQQSQATVDNVSEETDSLLEQWRDVQEQIQTTETYIAQIERLIADQVRRIAQLEDDIESATMTKRQITPLMLEMVDKLATFIELDVPFLLDERTTRVENLQGLMEESNISDSEKFRALLEAYTIEVDFGRNIEAYSGELTREDGTTEVVDFLRVGRTVLLYQTQDDKESGVWNNSERRWQVLSSSYNQNIAKALRIAQDQEAPDLLVLPVPAPGEAQ